MLKIWKGPEMEGTKVGIMTLFVCSDEVIDIKKLLGLVQSNQDVRRIYFGAGKTRFQGAIDWKALYDYCFMHSIEVVIEVGSAELDKFIKLYDNLVTNFIVVKYEMPFTYNNIQFKTDDNDVVKIYNASAQTSLVTLKENNLFDCDVMLIEEE